MLSYVIPCLGISFSGQITIWSQKDIVLMSPFSLNLLNYITGLTLPFLFSCLSAGSKFSFQLPALLLLS